MGFNPPRRRGPLLVWLIALVFIKYSVHKPLMPDFNKPHYGNSNSNSLAPQANSKGLLKRKFYVRSGKSRWMVLAIDADTAALRFIQNALKECMISGRKPVNKQLKLVDTGALELLAKVKLDSRIHVSEAGFSRSEAGQFVTSLVIKRWRSQIAAIEKLIRPKK